MSEWWTYRPVDFLMFAPRAYWRLFELHNQAVWPWPLMLSALGLAALWWLRRPSLPVRVLLLGVALAWAVVGWFFLHQRFAPIHWVMNGAAWAFGVGFVGGWFVGFVRNFVTAVWIFFVRTRAQFSRNFLDHI